MKIAKRTVYSFAILLALLVGSWYYGKEVYIGELTAGVMKIGEETLVVEVAGTHASRMKGLSGREDLKEDTGLLFAFEQSGYHEFWMKDMKFPIDIIWLDSNFRIVDIKKGAEPSSYPEVFRPKEEAQYAVETISGFADKHKVNIGDKAVFIDHSLEKK